MPTRTPDVTLTTASGQKPSPEAQWLYEHIQKVAFSGSIEEKIENDIPFICVTDGLKDAKGEPSVHIQARHVYGEVADCWQGRRTLVL